MPDDRDTGPATVVSLLPAATDMVCALGAAERIAAVTHECDHPAVAHRPRVTGTPVFVGDAAAAVDAQVRSLHASGLPLFTLDERAIAALAPRVILTQALCDVCAVSETDVRALAARLTPPPAITTLAGTTIDTIFDDIRAVAAALDIAGEGTELIAGMRERLRRVHLRLKAAVAPRPRVAIIEWTDPLYAAGHWAPDVVRRAGGLDVVATAGAHSAVVTVDAIRAARPDVLIVAPCGYDLSRARASAHELLTWRDWAWATALPVWAMDGNALLSRPGPNVVRAVEVIAAVLHPALFGSPDVGSAVRVV